MKNWQILGVLATALIVLILPIYALNETTRMADTSQALLGEAITAGQVVYAENCVLCHGAEGEGIGTYPPLTSAVTMDYDSLYKVIERGRYGTAMAAWGVDEGGVLNQMEIEQLIALIQSPSHWPDTARTVERLGLSPPEVVQIDLTDDLLAEIAALPHGEVLARALPVYAVNCVGCHGANGEGNSVGPALNEATLRDSRTDEELTRSISNGIPGTLMAAWNQTLTTENIADLVALVRYWAEIPAGSLPEPDLPPIVSTDAEVLLRGEQLYDVACAGCHGPSGEGSRMAPALNTQSFLTQTPDQAIKAIIAQGVSNTRMPAWGNRLSDADLNSLVSFIRSWESTAPAVANPSVGSSYGNQGGGNQGGGQGPPWLRPQP